MSTFGALTLGNGARQGPLAPGTTFSKLGAEISRAKVLMVYLLKHIDGISAYTKGYKSQREDVRGRLTDAIVYLMLLWSMILEES